MGGNKAQGNHREELVNGAVRAGHKKKTTQKKNLIATDPVLSEACLDEELWGNWVSKRVSCGGGPQKTSFRWGKVGPVVERASGRALRQKLWCLWGKEESEELLYINNMNPGP